MLGLVPQDDHGEQRRLLLPPARHRHPEHRPGDPCLGVPQLGLVGEVAGEADGGLGHAAALLNAWPGGLPCPWNRGRWTPWHATRPTGASDRANEVGQGSGLLSLLGSGAELVGGACGWGRACQHRPARSLHPGRGGRTRLPPRELLAARPRLSRSGSRPPEAAASACASLVPA
jgi:hypothetical protein